MNTERESESKKLQELLLACWSATQNARDILCDIENRLCLLEGAAVASKLGYATASDATTNGGTKMLLQTTNATKNSFGQ